MEVIVSKPKMIKGVRDVNWANLITISWVTMLSSSDLWSLLSDDVL